MVKAAKGVLIQCDPSIKAIINKIDEKYHDFIIEDLDDETVVVKETKLYELKQKLADVSRLLYGVRSCVQLLDIWDLFRSSAFSPKVVVSCAHIA